MFRFDNTYPISAPAVQFVVDDTHKAPVHPVRVLPNLALFADPNQNAWNESTYTRMDMWVYAYTPLGSC